MRLCNILRIFVLGWKQYGASTYIHLCQMSRFSERFHTDNARAVREMVIRTEPTRRNIATDHAPCRSPIEYEKIMHLCMQADFILDP